MSAPTHPIIREALAAHEVFRKLGFTPDEIYFRPRPGRLFMTVRRAEKEFNFDLGEHDIKDTDSLIKQWAVATEWWNGGPEPERRELFDTSETRKNAVMIIAALQTKGFAVRRSDA